MLFLIHKLARHYRDKKTVVLRCKIKTGKFGLHCFLTDDFILPGPLTE